MSKIYIFLLLLLLTQIASRYQLTQQFRCGKQANICKGVGFNHYNLSHLTFFTDQSFFFFVRKSPKHTNLIFSLSQNQITKDLNNQVSKILQVQFSYNSQKMGLIYIEDNMIKMKIYIINSEEIERQQLTYAIDKIHNNLTKIEIDQIQFQIVGFLCEQLVKVTNISREPSRIFFQLPVKSVKNFTMSENGLFIGVLDNSQKIWVFKKDQNSTELSYNSLEYRYNEKYNNPHRMQLKTIQKQFPQLLVYFQKKIICFIYNETSASMQFSHEFPYYNEISPLFDAFFKVAQPQNNYQNIIVYNRNQDRVQSLPMHQFSIFKSLGFDIGGNFIVLQNDMVSVYEIVDDEEYDDSWKLSLVILAGIICVCGIVYFMYQWKEKRNNKASTLLNSDDNSQKMID